MASIKLCLIQKSEDVQSDCGYHGWAGLFGKWLRAMEVAKYLEFRWCPEPVHLKKILSSCVGE